MKKTAVLSLLASLLGGCEKSPPRQAGADAPAGGSPPAVAAVKVESKDLEARLHLAGELWAYRNVALFAKVAGFVETVEVDRGSAVKEGQLLARLTAPEFEAQ